MKYALVIAALLFAAPHAGAETLEELEAQLEAQKQINELQRQRIETLEAELAGRKIPPPARDAEADPEFAEGDPEADRALERALQRRGSALLAPYVVEVTPRLFWIHSGSDANSSTDDVYEAGLDARVGLPGGWMVGAAVPFLHRDINGLSENTGVGDVSAAVWKSLFTQDGTRPSLVGSVRYTAPTGEDFGEADVPLGLGFHRFDARLSTVKTVAPIAFYGDLAYTYYLDETIAGAKWRRSDAIGFGLGASLAVTPEISLSVELDAAFEDELEVNGTKLSGSGTTLGLVDLSAGILLSQNVFLILSSAFGVTDDSPDLILGMSLPIRF